MSFKPPLPLMTFVASALVACCLFAGGCGPSGQSASTGGGAGSGEISGDIRIDGSSTVFPISKALAQEFMAANPKARVTVAESGTGGGFKKFISGEIDITGASRPIDEKEIEQLKEKGIEYIEIPIAFDGLTVVINPGNTWATTLTTEELKKLWEPNSSIVTWHDLRHDFPTEKIKFFSPGTDSGTFDYFTEAIIEKKKEQRTDAQTSEDDNTLVTGVVGEKYSIGYFGYSYFEQNKDKLKAVSVDNGAGPIAPSPDSIQNNTYSPLSRPLFLYISKSALDSKPALRALVEFFFASGKPLVNAVGYVAFSDEDYATVKSHFDSGATGSKFAGKKTVGSSISQIVGGK